MKSTSMGHEVPEDELVFFAPIPHVPLGAKDDIQQAGFRFCQPSTHGEPDTAERHAALTAG
jgi:hypothetical protein